ncbi:hypothetical protein VTN77DRAFT_4537 [Rasamsonia byssochlamydoides]|uniref:uncharacterized protein n=1 Tax=Rasamsonia byssochlamydoides TaxID=89139 RepID=UPI0037447301
MTLPHPTRDSPLPAISISELLASGKPFVEFPTYNILDLKREIGFESSSEGDAKSSEDSNSNSNGVSSSFADWLSRKLQIGHPFVIKGFNRLPEWDEKLFSIEGLIECSTRKNIPIRNCTTGRDLSFTLRKFADAARQSYREFRNFYARDLQCPPEWLDQCRKLLPPELQYDGRADLFQWLPPCARSEVMMAYVGSEGSSSGFHRCFSSTVALNLLVESMDRPVICFGTDFASQVKYDSFMAAKGASPHVDWLNLSPDELMKADFPIYVCEQEVGDVVVFPPATAHQVWNVGTLSTKMVWNILHPLSLEAGLNYVQPPFNRLCHPDVARTNLSLACAMLSLVKDNGPGPRSLPPDLPLLCRLFRQMVRDESIEDAPATEITLVQIPENMIATCNFCGTAIWNRHVRCTECRDFDLCLLCYLSGRSCEHVSSYSWAEIVPQETCDEVIRRASEILRCPPDDIRTSSDRRKCLGTAVNDLMKARRSTSTRLCHLCRIDHLEWKGRRCDTCNAFFCFRGLYRHFDMYAADVMRHAGIWMCPKCMETCNCRCCHFSSAYVKAEKPASKRRVKPADPRGKIMGFTDNVFDQKKRNTSTTTTSNSAATGEEPRGHKRPLSVSAFSFSTPSRHLTSHADGASDSPSVKWMPSSSGVDRSTARETPDADINHAGSVNGSRRNRSEDRFASSSMQGESVSLPPIKTRGVELPSNSIHHDPSLAMNTLANAAGTRDRVPTAQDQERRLSENSYLPQQSGVSKTASGDVTSQCHRESSDSVNYDKAANSASNAFHPESLTSQGDSHSQSHSHSVRGSNYLPPITQPAASLSSSSSSSSPILQNAHHDSLSTLESQLHRLRQYAEELLSLSLQESHQLLQREIQALEQRIMAIKRERSERLLQGLESEFPALVGVREGIKREGSKLGYF